MYGQNELFITQVVLDTCDVRHILAKGYEMPCIGRAFANTLAKN